MPTRNRSTTESGRGGTDEADLAADAGNACITQLFHLATPRARKSARTCLRPRFEFAELAHVRRCRAVANA